MFTPHFHNAHGIGSLGLGLIVLGYFLVTDRDRIAQTRLLFTAGTSETEAHRTVPVTSTRIP